MDGYLENAMDYVQETFENANEWMKENDFLKFPMVEANFNAYIHPNGGGVTVFLNPGTQSGPSFAPSLGQNNNPASSSSMGGDEGSSSSFSPFGNNGIGQGNIFGSGDKFGASTSGASEPKWEPYPSIDLSKPQVLTEVTFEREGMYDYMGNMKGMPTMPIPTPEQENKNSNGENTEDNTQAGGSSEESKQEAEAAEKVKQEEAKVKNDRLEKATIGAGAYTGAQIGVNYGKAGGLVGAVAGGIVGSVLYDNTDKIEEVIGEMAENIGKASIEASRIATGIKGDKEEL